MTTTDALLAAYDRRLRTDAETAGAVAVARLGPLRLATLPGGRGLVTYPHVDGTEPVPVARLVAEALGHFRSDPGVRRVEWKTRGHDRTPGLHEELVRNGFEPDQEESIMIGEARSLDLEARLPPGVRVRRIVDEGDVRAMAAMQDVVFEGRVSDDSAQALVSRLAQDDGMELWVAEADGRIVGAGRLQPVPGTEFAGIWGGATLPSWRGQGIYRALLAARAHSALAAGTTLIHSDSTEYSRPILERSGFVRVSTTTPYRWRR